jgi:hypothetical protein
MNIYHLTNQTSEDDESDHLYEMTVVAPDFDTAVMLACQAARREGPEAWEEAENVMVGTVTSPLGAFQQAHVLCRDSHRW